MRGRACLPLVPPGKQQGPSACCGSGAGCLTRADRPLVWANWPPEQSRLAARPEQGGPGASLLRPGGHPALARWPACPGEAATLLWSGQPAQVQRQPAGVRRLNRVMRVSGPGRPGSRQEMPQQGPELRRCWRLGAAEARASAPPSVPHLPALAAPWKELCSRAKTPVLSHKTPVWPHENSCAAARKQLPCPRENGCAGARTGTPL